MVLLLFFFFFFLCLSICRLSCVKIMHCLIVMSCLFINTFYFLLASTLFDVLNPSPSFSNPSFLFKIFFVNLPESGCSTHTHTNIYICINTQDNERWWIRIFQITNLFSNYSTIKKNKFKFFYAKFLTWRRIA